MSEPIPSPCVLVCQIDFDSGNCHGCGRTIDEIMAWGKMDPPQRDRIMAILPERLAELPKGERRITKRRQRQRDRGTTSPKSDT